MLIRRFCTDWNVVVRFVSDDFTSDCTTDARRRNAFGRGIWWQMMRTIGLVPPTDIDSDGVTDEVDACQESDLTPTVVVEGCDSGVDNVLFDDGCSLADLVYDGFGDRQ